MQSSTQHSDQEIQELRELVHQLGPHSTVVDFEEQIQMAGVLSTLRLWRREGKVVGFAFVDDYNNLWFDSMPGGECCSELDRQIIEWGVHCIRDRNPQGEPGLSLDSTCRQDNPRRIEVLLSHGFIPQQVRSLQFSRSLEGPIREYPLPAGFRIRHTTGEDEVDRLVELHRAAFGTDNMTRELRLAIMRAPAYVPDWDLLVVAPDGELAALCICGFLDGDARIGYTDPVATHPKYQRLGLGRGIISAGLKILQAAGAEHVELGTSSENTSMQRLAEAMGFQCIAEKLWFSKALGDA